MSTFFIADPLHINTKNFGSLYDYFKESKSTVLLNQERSEWMSAFGDYRAHQAQLEKEYQQLKDLAPRQLFELSVQEINLFKVARAEILSYLITHPSIVEAELPNSLRDLFLILIQVDRETVLWNMATALQWIHFWSDCIKFKKPKFVLIFSGSQIYARALLELLKNRPPRCFVLESSFTGSDNYIEEKYEPIANNSNLRFNAYYKSLGLHEQPNERDRSRNKALNKIIASRNKNVIQPAPDPSPLFDNDRPVLLICGQVLNDFSVLEYRGIGLNSLAFYKALIQQLLDKTDLNIVFKAHPWERKKANLREPLTLNSLALNFPRTEGNLHNDRLLLVEDHNLKSIFNQATYVAGINSQALLEAAFEGFQPIQFGDAFYGGKGFTSDYPLHCIDQFIEDLAAHKIPARLGIAGYSSFETFITKALQFSMVSAFPSGKIRLRTIFGISQPIPIITTSKNQQPSTINRMKGLIGPKPQDIPAQGATTTQSTASRKWKKFIKTPRKFFLDSKNKKTRWLYVFFPASIFK
jgi:hypothetical protein